MQPVPKAVHRSGCRDKHNWPRPITPQSVMPLLNHCDLLRHVGVNNLPKVVTRQRRGREPVIELATFESQVQPLGYRATEPLVGFYPRDASYSAGFSGRRASVRLSDGLSVTCRSYPVYHTLYYTHLLPSL